jgi:hypothetical protein
MALKLGKENSSCLVKVTPNTYFFAYLFVSEAIRLMLRYMSGEAGISTIWGLRGRAGNSDQKPSQNQPLLVTKFMQCPTLPMKDEPPPLKA